VTANTGDMSAICADLRAEHEAVDGLVARLAEADWDRQTPAPGWAIRDQVSHLAYFDRAAITAVTEPERFQAETAALLAAPQGLGDRDLALGRSATGAGLLLAWREGGRALLGAFAPLDPKARIPWYGPAMGALSFATARLMETWAHAQDIADTLGLRRPATERLRHVAHLGVLARPFSFAAHGRQAPPDPVRVELTSPSGDRWDWGAEDATDRVAGPALDFCLVVTQRRHPIDTDLVVVGEVASEWIGIAQAFAGPPGPGRAPGQFARRV